MQIVTDETMAAPADGTNAEPQAGVAVQSTTVTAHFKMIFLSVLGLTCFTFLSLVLLSVFVRKPTEQAQNVMTIAGTISQMGVGAIFGLLGGVKST